MIHLYTAATGNGQRPAILLEELGLPYKVHKVDLAKGAQRDPEFLRLNPRGQIPVLVDDDGPGGQRLVLTQSHAILLHYALQSGRFLPEAPLERALALQWLSFAASDAAPTSGVVFALANFVPEKVESTTQFFLDRLMAHFRYADQRLAESEFLAGPLSIADFALYPVYAARRKEIEAQGALANLQRWGEALAARPSVQKAMQVPG